MPATKGGCKKMKKIRPAFKCHGGKYYLSDWIIANFPENYEHFGYLEPFCGGANVLINKQRSNFEAINDLDVNLLQIFRALRDEPKEFIRRLNLVKYCEESFQRALKKAASASDDYLDQAVTEYVLRRMSRGGLKKAFAWSNRLRGSQPGDVNAWKTALTVLPQIAERLRGVYIFNSPAIDAIQLFNQEDMLVYCDPPYLHETRVSKTVYSSEMDTQDHIRLAHVLNQFSGKVIISGYPSPLYNRLYKGWNCEKRKVANHASQQKSKEKKVEVVWKNF